MSVPSDSNISTKEFEKLSMHKDLEIKIAKMWKLKTKTIPSHCKGTWCEQKGNTEIC